MNLRILIPPFGGSSPPAHPTNDLRIVVSLLLVKFAMGALVFTPARSHLATETNCAQLDTIS